MRVAVFNIGEYFTPHPETELELIQLHLDRGDEVTHYHCNAALPACQLNPTHHVARCVDCVARRELGLRLLAGRVRRGPLLHLTAADRRRVAGLRTAWASVADLNTYSVDGFDLGLAVSAAVIDLTRDPDPPLARHAALVADTLRAAFAVYLSALNVLRRDRPDRVYAFNGRWSSWRAVFRACQREGVDCRLHERGGPTDAYALYPNVLPHDLEYTAAQIRAAWDRADPATRPAVGRRFFEDKVKGVETQWRSFVAGQTPGALPPGWDPGRPNVGVFLSSEFEFAAVGPEWANPLYRDQTDGLARIAAGLAVRAPRAVLHVRAHPNMAGLRNRSLGALYALDGGNVRVIRPESGVSSYALLRACDKVLTFGSTVGIEAVYWGKPSVLVGRAFYQDLGGNYVPATHAEAVDLLARDLPPKPAEPALVYGHYMRTYGVRYRHYVPDGPFAGRFRGRRVDEGFGAAAKAAFRALFAVAAPAFRFSGLNWLHRRRVRRRLGAAAPAQPGRPIPLPVTAAGPG